MSEKFDNVGCYLEVVPEQKLVWTTALLDGYRPTSENAPFVFTAILTLRPDGKGGTHYVVTLMHDTEDGAKKHEEMGFSDGWVHSFPTTDGHAFQEEVRALRRLSMAFRGAASSGRCAHSPLANRRRTGNVGCK